MSFFVHPAKNQLGFILEYFGFANSERLEEFVKKENFYYRDCLAVEIEDRNFPQIHVYPAKISDKDGNTVPCFQFVARGTTSEIRFTDLGRFSSREIIQAIKDYQQEILGKARLHSSLGKKPILSESPLV